MDMMMDMEALRNEVCSSLASHIPISPYSKLQLLKVPLNVFSTLSGDVVRHTAAEWCIEA